MMNITNMDILFTLALSCVILAITVAVKGIHQIKMDTLSKETMFRLQLMGAESKSLKDALPVNEMYQVLDGMIRFYTARQLTMTDLSRHTEQELSLLIDEVILSISSDVELHLGNGFKRSWETYFDKIPTENGSVPSHLNLYIHDNAKMVLIRAIESMKINSQRKHPSGQQSDHTESTDETK